MKERILYLNPDVFAFDNSETDNYRIKIVKLMLKNNFSIELSRKLDIDEDLQFRMNFKKYRLADNYPRDNKYIPWEGVQSICQMEAKDTEFLKADLNLQLTLFLKNEVNPSLV